MTKFAICLNELTAGLKERLPPTDSRLRPDQHALEQGVFDQVCFLKLTDAKLSFWKFHSAEFWPQVEYSGTALNDCLMRAGSFSSLLGGLAV